MVTLFIPFSTVSAQNTYNFEFKDSTGCKALSSKTGVFADFSQCIVDLISRSFVPYIIALTVLAFLVGVFGYVKNAGDDSKRAESLRLVAWSLVGIFFMITVWAFAFMFSQFFGIDPESTSVIPQFGP